MLLLFVCTGNICRSPTAERLARAFSGPLGLENLTASSAGTHAVIGHPMHEYAAGVLESLGGASENFRARQLTSRIASSPDLIITMTKSQRDAVLEYAPQKLHRTFTLIEAARLRIDFGAESVADLGAARSAIPSNASLDIADPIGRELGVFETVGSQIAELMPAVLDLCRLR